MSDKEIERYLIDKDPFIANTLCVLKRAKNTAAEKIEWLKSLIEKKQQVLELLDTRIQLVAQFLVTKKGHEIYELPPELPDTLVCTTWQQLGWMELPTTTEIEDNNKDFKYRRALINTFRVEWLQAQISLLEATNPRIDTYTHIPEESTTDQTRRTVEKYFNFTLGNDPRKHKQILSAEDHAKLIEWVIYYFDNHLTVPEIKAPIREINTSKGNTVHTFRLLFKELHPIGNYPVSLWELIKAIFHAYREDNPETIRKTKEPQYYDLLPHKN